MKVVWMAGRPRQGRAPFNRLLSSLPLVGPTSPPLSTSSPHPITFLLLVIPQTCLQSDCGEKQWLMIEMSPRDGVRFCAPLKSVVVVDIWADGSWAEQPPWQPQWGLLLQTLNISSSPFCSKHKISKSYHIIPPKLIPSSIECLLAYFTPPGDHPIPIHL